MKAQTEKTDSNKSNAVARAPIGKQEKKESGDQFKDSRVDVVAQRKLAGLADTSPQAGRIAQMQAVANSSAGGTVQRAKDEDEKYKNSPGQQTNPKDNIKETWAGIKGATKQNVIDRAQTTWKNFGKPKGEGHAIQRDEGKETPKQKAVRAQRDENAANSERAVQFPVADKVRRVAAEGAKAAANFAPPVAKQAIKAGVNKANEQAKGYMDQSTNSYKAMSEAEEPAEDQASMYDQESGDKKSKKQKHEDLIRRMAHDQDS